MTIEFSQRMCVCTCCSRNILGQASHSSNPLRQHTLVIMASQFFAQLPIKNTFIHFNIDRFDIQARKRSSSAPPRIYFSTEVDAPLTAKKRKRNAPKKFDENAILNEFTQLARAESWIVFGRRLIERQERIDERWEHLKYKLLTTAPMKKKKRFTLTKRLFFNAAPWIDPVEMLRARKNGFFRRIEPDTIEFWASDIDLIHKNLSPIFSVFVQFKNLVERGQMMMMLPCGTTFVYNYQQDLHLDDLRAKVKDTSSQPFDKQRLICQGKELKGSRVLNDFDVHPGDVISVLFN